MEAEISDYKKLKETGILLSEMTDADGEKSERELARYESKKILSFGGNGDGRRAVFDGLRADGADRTDIGRAVR